MASTSAGTNRSRSPASSDCDRNRYLVTAGQCFRNGTTINASIIGLKGAIEVYGWSVISFDCPTMFGKRGL